MKQTITRIETTKTTIELSSEDLDRIIIDYLKNSYDIKTIKDIKFNYYENHGLDSITIYLESNSELN